MLCGLLAQFVLFETPPTFIFNRLFSPFYWLLEFQGSLYEWHFRAKLDCYMTWLGIAFAIAFNRSTSVFSSSPRANHAIILTIACSLGIIAWTIIMLPMNKFVYNGDYHRYVAVIPMASYLVLRNLLPSFRRNFVPLFAKLGRITLETYILQHHVYMVDDAKMRLVILPGEGIWEMLNFVIVTCLFLALSQAAFQSTTTLTTYICEPPKNTSSLNSGGPPFSTTLISIIQRFTIPLSIAITAIIINQILLATS
jgi:N-acetylneuraminate 9-O-acetyltransferase